MQLSNEAVLKIEKTLSIPRLSKYENFYKNSGLSYTKQDVLMLYERNLVISNKFFYLLNYFEIVLRNAVVEAIEISFNSSPTNSWHLNVGFIQSLSNRGRHSHRRMFNDVAQDFPNAPSKIIPELKFVFWQKMLLTNYDQRIWQGCFTQIFPNALTEDRQTFYDWVNQLRDLRNRIAHHEPIIFNRILEDDLKNLMLFIHCRCEHTYSLLEPFALDLEQMLISGK
ncbi:Abi family protein [Acinetobacter bereziniae]|uniref:Abi family protein n=1 Tax=Acinetobacter bereziniae TaxID=106648 RepID=UPI000EF72D0E|nr:Abi family protein [Acinetobacter bereziniae]